MRKHMAVFWFAVAIFVAGAALRYREQRQRSVAFLKQLAWELRWRRTVAYVRLALGVAAR